MMIECEAFNSNRCKSCDLIKLPYESGLQSKIKDLSSLFEGVEILAPIKSSMLKEYRNKAKFVIGGTLDEPIIGIPSPINKKSISALLDCPLHSNKMNEIATFIKENIKTFGLTPYDIQQRAGEFKYLFISEGHKTGQISLRFGMRSMESFERVKKLFHSLKTKYPKIEVCSFEIQPKHAALFEGEQRLLTTSKYIQHDLTQMQLSSSTTNFFQVNAPVAQKLYETVFTKFKDEGISIGVDLFCGVGGFAQQISRFCKKVYAIEINQVAIDCARFSLEINKIQNIEFICDDANNFQDHIKDKVDLLVVNPPRRGVGKDLCQTIIKIDPQFIVYSSCHAKNLATDIETLKNHYQIESLTPVDMFPLTKHLEVLCILKRR